jgi:predicted phage tail protein
LVTSYVIQAGSSPGAANLARFNTGNASTSFAASAPAGLYYVRVSAANQCGVGPPSNEVSFTSGADRPGAPQDLAWLVSPERVVTLSWSAPTAGTPTAYLIEAGSAPGLADVVTISTGSPARSFTGSAQPGTYYVRVRAVNGSGPGAPSAEVVVTVP